MRWRVRQGVTRCPGSLVVVVLTMLVLVQVGLLAVHLVGVAECRRWSVHGGRGYPSPFLQDMYYISA